MIKLFAVGFPRTMDELQLAQLFGPYGDIELITIVRDQFTKESKGFGFVHMKTENGALSAIQALDGHAFGDRKLEVRLADEKQTPVTKPLKIKFEPAPKPAAPQKKKRPRIGK